MGLLGEVIELVQQREQVMLQSQNENSQQSLDLLWQTLLNLQQPSSHPAQIIGVDRDRVLLVDQWKLQNEVYILSTLYSFQTFLAYLFEDIPNALIYANAQLVYEHSRKSGYLVTQIWLIDALTRLAAYPQSDDQTQRQLLVRINDIQHQLLKLTQLMTGNFQHKYDLIAAEKCRVFGYFNEAMDLYDRSISGAKTSQYLQEEAIAQELAAKFYLGWCKLKIAAIYMQDAYATYTRWGATAKTADLARRYPLLLGTKPHPQSTYPPEDIGLGMRAIDFDLTAAIESAQVLSSTIELPMLIDRLCQILIKNSGANICIPILRSHSNPDLWQAYKTKPVRSKTPGTDLALRLTCTTLANCHHLPQTLIAQTIDRCQKIILTRDTTDPDLLADDYLHLHRPQSAMCLPLIHRGELQGMIYLENRHTADVFSPNRQIFLEFIASQVVITLQNVQLYKSVSQRSAAMETSIDGMAILENGRFSYINPSYAQMYGYRVDELIGEQWQRLCDPADLATVEEAVCAVLATAGTWRGETISTHKDGTPFEIELTLFVIANGELVSICRNISEQKALIKSRQSQQDALTAITNWTAEGKAGNDLYQACTKYLAQRFDLRYAFIGRSIDDVWSKARIESLWTGTEFLAPYEMDLLGTACLATYQNSWTIVRSDVQSNFPQATVLSSLDAESYLSVVIRDGDGNMLGNLGVIDTKPLPQDISALQFILQLFADRISAEMKRQCQENELRKIQQQIEAFINNSPAAMYLKDLEGRYQMLNQTCIDLAGGNPDLYLGQTDDALYPAAIANQIRANDLQVIQSGESITVEEIGTHPDGTEHTYISNKFVLTDQAGKPYALGGVSTDITNLKQTEIALRQSESRYQRLSDNIPGVIYQFRLAPDGGVTIPYISAGCWDLFQISPAAVMADSNSLMQLVHPDDRLMLEGDTAISAQNMTVKSPEIRMVLNDGEIKWIKAISRPELQPDGAIIWDGVILDITAQQNALHERNKIEVDLITSQQKYYSLIQSVNGVVWEYDLSTDRFTFVSDRAVSFGYPISDWLSQPNFWQHHVHPEDLEPTLRTYNEAIEYRYDCEFEYRMLTADDRVIWVYDISTLICDPDGTPIATTGLFIDISNIKQVETDLHQANAQLESANTELQQATRLKDAFLATMSHELRTPLNAILGMSQAFQSQTFGTINPRQLKSISTIERNGRHLLSLINDILDISKISAGKLDLNITKISPQQLCESSLISIEQQALQKQIQLDVRIAADLDTISVDERRIRQVLINLLTNAVKFTPEGGSVTLAIGREQQQTSEQQLPQAYVYFSVTDTGIGIESSDLSKLFQPFIQIDHTLNREYDGTGLGLSIVKQIVELHGGTVSIDSKIGTGSCFTVKLPQTSPPPDTSHTPLILLAEDDQGSIGSFSSYLSAKGYRIIVAQTGSEAISLAQSDRPDLILIDLHIPDIDGFEAISRIHQQPELAQIPIIALTARSIAGDRAKCLTIGATECLEKPVKLRELNQTIQECLNAIG